MLKQVHIITSESANIDSTVYDRIFQFISILIFLSCFLSLGFLISVSQRGFDITDEGFHLLASQFPEEVLSWPNVAYIYTGLMLKLVGKNIIALRILSEFFLFTSASFFFFGLYKLIIRIFPELVQNFYFKMTALPMTCLGALIYYFSFGLNPNYNTLNAMVMYIATGFIFLSLACLQKKFFFSMLNSFLAGIGIGMMVLIKFPTAISLALLFFFILLFWPISRKINRMFNIIILAIGACSWIFVHIAFLQSFDSLWNTLCNGIATCVAFGTHQPYHCFQHYIPEIFYIFVNAFVFFWKSYLILFFGAMCYWRFRKNISSKHLTIFFILIFLFTTKESLSLQFYKAGASQFAVLFEAYLGWLLLFLFCVIMASIYQKFTSYKNLKQLFLISALLFLLPFAGAGGTTNVISINLLQYMGSWFALIYLMLSGLSYLTTNRWVLLLGASIISAFSCSQIVSAGFIEPYGLNTTLKYQTIPTAIGYPTSYVKLDKATHEFFNQINLIAINHGFKPGDDILAFSNMPGIVFSLGAKSLVTPWYTSYPNTKQIYTQLLKLAPLERIRNAFILQNKTGVSSTPNFEKLGINFPGDYVFCGEVIWPQTGDWVRLWKPRAKRG